MSENDPGLSTRGPKPRTRPYGIGAVWILFPVVIVLLAVTTVHIMLVSEHPRTVPPPSPEAARTELVWQLGNRLLQPMPDKGDGLTAGQLDALATLASSDDEVLGLQFFEHALKTEATTHQLRLRGEAAVIAVVGLRVGTREKVEKLLADRLADKSLSEGHRLDLALLASWLGDLSPATARPVAAILVAEMTRERDRHVSDLVAGQLLVVLGSLSPSEAAATLIPLLERQQTSRAQFLARIRALITVAERMHPAEADQARGRALTAVVGTIDRNSEDELARTASALVVPMQPATAVRQIVEALGRGASFAQQTLEEELLRAVRRLTPDERPPLAKALAPALRRASASLIHMVREAIHELASQLSPAQTVQLVDAITRSGDGEKEDAEALWAWVHWLRYLGPLLPPEDSSRRTREVAEKLFKAATLPTLRRDKDSFAYASHEIIRMLAVHLTPPQTARLIDAITRAGDAEHDDAEALSSWAYRLHSNVPLLPPEEADRRIREVADKLLKAVAAPADDARAGYLIVGLERIADRMRSPEALVVFFALVEALPKSRQHDRWVYQYRDALTALAARLDPPECAIAAEKLTPRLADVQVWREALVCTHGLLGLLERLPPEGVSRVARALAKAHERNVEPNALSQLTSALVAVAKRLPEDEALALLTDALKQLPEGSPARKDLAEGLAPLAEKANPGGDAIALVEMLREAKPGSLPGLVEPLSKVTPRLTPAQASRVADALVKAMENPGGPGLIGPLAPALAALDDRLTDRPEAAKFYQRAAAVALKALEEGVQAQQFPYQAALDVVQKLPPEDALAARARIADLLAQRVPRWRSGGLWVADSATTAKYHYAAALASVAAGLGKDKADAVCFGAIQALIEKVPTATGSGVADLAWGIADLAWSLRPESADKALTLLREALAKNASRAPYDSDPAVAALAARQGFTPGLRILAPALHEGTGRHLAEGFVLLAGTAEDPAAAAREFLKLRKSVSASSRFARKSLGVGLVRLAARLPAQDEVAILKEALADRGRSDEDWPLTEALTAANAKLPPGPTARALLQEMKAAKSRGEQEVLASALRDAADRVAPAEAAEIAEILIQAMGLTADRDALVILAWGLREAVDGLPAVDAARICSPAAGFLVDALSKDYLLAELKEASRTRLREVWADRNRDFTGLRQYGSALKAVAPHLGPDEAVRIADEYGPVMAVLTHLQGQFAEDLAHLAPRLEGDAGYRLAQALTRGMALGSAPWQPSKTTNALADILAGVGPAERKQRASAIATATAAAQPLATVAFLRPALEPVRGPLSTQQLVALLKQPSCCGHARRVVLDQLGHRMGRPFTDVWAFVRHAQAERLDLDLTSPPPGARGGP